MRSSSLTLGAVALFFLVLFLSACEESVDPILESDRQFTLFGTLDMNQDTQYMRVIPIRETLLPVDPNAPLNVTFTSTDLVTNETLVWRDSTVRFDDGSIGHVFYTPLLIQPEHTYRIEVSSPGLNFVTWAETTVPSLPQPRVFPEDVTSITTPTGAQIRATQKIVWEGVGEQPFSLEHWYRFLVIGDFVFEDVMMPFEARSGPAENQSNAWEVNLNLLTDRTVVDSLVDLKGKALAGLGMTITVLDEAFVPPGGAFDIDVLQQPGTLSNVENGFGFVGSVGRFSVEWLLADTSAQILRYAPVGAFKSALPPDVLARLQHDALTADAHPGHHSGF